MLIIFSDPVNIITAVHPPGLKIRIFFKLNWIIGNRAEEKISLSWQTIVSKLYARINGIFWDQ
jgi:hypothetical protein